MKTPFILPYFRNETTKKKYHHPIFLMLIFLLSFSKLQAQLTQQPQWIIPEKRVSFLTPTPTILPLPTNNGTFMDPFGNSWSNYQDYNSNVNQSQPGDLRTYNAAYNSNGEILFFIVNGIIYRGDGTYISHMMYEADISFNLSNLNNTNSDHELRNMRGGSQLCIVPFAGNNANAATDTDRFYILAPGRHQLVSTNSSLQHTLLCCILNQITILDYSTKHRQ